MAKEKVVIGIGEVLWDIYQNEKHLGGAPANFAIHARQMNCHGIVASRVGDDGMGQELIDTLRSRHIPTDCIQVDRKNGTGTVIVSLDIKGVPSFRCSENVAFDYLAFDDNLQNLAVSADAILFGTLAQRNPVSRATIRKFLSAAPSALKIFDPNLRAWDATTRQIVKESLAFADVLKLNGEEAGRLRAILPGSGRTRVDFHNYLLESYDLKVLAITFGEDGCELRRPGEKVRSTGIRVDAVDTTGCGDAFAAGLVTKYLEGGALQEVADFANQAGAFTATRFGAAPSYTLRDLEAFISDHPLERREEPSK